eukprot:1317568-Amphidinium_carterae.1
MRYVRDAPLDAITDAYTRAGPSEWAPPPQLTELQDRLERLESRPVSSPTEHEFVVNVRSNVVHKVLVGCSVFGPSAWKGVCGWKF